MNNEALLRLREIYAWPDQIPDVPEDWHGWLCPDTANALGSRLNHTTRFVIECGTWLGFSARAILQSAPNAHLFCIDTWKGSPEHLADKGDWHRRLATLHEVCQKNLWPWRDRCTLVEKDSISGLGLLYDLGCTPDLIYIDSKHTLGRVTAELSVCLELFPYANVVLDDYNNAAVKLACDEHARLSNRPMETSSAACIFSPWRTI